MAAVFLSGTFPGGQVPPGECLVPPRRKILRIVKKISNSLIVIRQM